MKLSRPWVWLLVVSSAVWLPPIASAEDWQAVGFVSSTVGVSTSRVCIGAPSANRPSDFGCPTTAPYINQTNGNVGIGTSAPTQKLEVKEGNLLFSDATNTAHGVIFQRNGSQKGTITTASGDLALLSNAGATNGIRFSTNGVDPAMLIMNTTGNVGIATTNPSNTLHVSGTARITSWTAIAANVTPTTALDVYGTISATNLLVNGVAVGGQADRIVSGTASVVAHASTGVSISAPLEVSGSIKIASTGTEVCNSETQGLIRFDAATGAVEMCRQ